MTSARLHLPPPALNIANGCAWLLNDETPFTTSYEVVADVGRAYRYRRAVRKQVETDLLRFFGLQMKPVLIGISDTRRPFFYFDRVTVGQWLDAGGRNWILAELEARSGQRVVAFPGAGGRS